MKNKTLEIEELKDLCERQRKYIEILHKDLRFYKKIVEEKKIKVEYGIS